MRITVRVRPGASRTAVGGSYGDPPALVVAVTAPAVDGRANEAVRDAVAAAFGVRVRDITVHAGHTARTKTLDLLGDDDEALARRLAELLR